MTMQPAQKPRSLRSPHGVQINSDLITRTPFLTSMKIFFAVGLTLTCLSFVALRDLVNFRQSIKIPICIIVCLLLGFLYAHLTELQHELLHEHGFGSSAVNRVLGFLVGMFMLSSYSHYRHQHMRHHRYLGTPKNSEFFIYPEHGLDCPFKLLLAAYNWSRFVRVGRLMLKGLLGQPPNELIGDKEAKDSSQEYAAYAVMVAGAVGYTVRTGDMSLVYSWILPLFLVSEPVHYLIELPEHFGLDAYSDPNVMSSTRTIESNWFMWWFTNGNNLHTAHHLHGRVPISKSRQLNAIVKHKLKVVEKSYFDFYRKVIAGELVPVTNERHAIIRKAAIH